MKCVDITDRIGWSLMMTVDNYWHIPNIYNANLVSQGEEIRGEQVHLKVHNPPSNRAMSKVFQPYKLA